MSLKLKSKCYRRDYLRTTVGAPARIFGDDLASATDLRMARRSGEDRVRQHARRTPPASRFEPKSKEGRRRGGSPMTIVWHTKLTAREYAAAGDDLEVPRPNCPACVVTMVFWGWYLRPLRVGSSEVRLRIRRAICKLCCSSHALLPDLVAVGRLDPVEVIGEAVADMATGSTAGPPASSLSLRAHLGDAR